MRCGIREATGLEFQSENGAMHACGHDLHTAMLPGAAALLRRSAPARELQGTVRLVFQPDEEGFHRSESHVLSAGVLKEALSLGPRWPFMSTPAPSGMVPRVVGTFMAGCTLFRVTVRGTGRHGAMPKRRRPH